MRLPGVVALVFLALSAPSPSRARPPVAASAQANAVCGVDYYRNSSGQCVHRPTRSGTIPAGATARCRDGTYSFSQHRRGTCSYHGGVAQWLEG